MNNIPNFHQMILNNLTEGVYFLDVNRVITFWNNGAEKITGYSEDEVLNTPCYRNLMRHTNSEGVEICQGLCPVAKTLLDGEIREEMLFIQHKNGYRVPVSVRVLPMRSLSNQIVGAVEIFSDMTPSSEQGKKMKALATLAYFDLVTGLPNRRYVESRIGIMLAEYKKNLSPFGLLLINIVGFKMLNDKYGQEVGDQVLRSVGRSVASGVGPVDVVGRWDGTRYMVICPNTKKALLLLEAEKLKTLANQAANLTGSREIVLKVSMAAVINQMDDTTASLKKRLAGYINESEARDGLLVMDED